MITKPGLGTRRYLKEGGGAAIVQVVKSAAKVRMDRVRAVAPGVRGGGAPSTAGAVVAGDGQELNRYRPSVDVLFRSGACVAVRCVGYHRDRHGVTTGPTGIPACMGRGAHGGSEWDACVVHRMPGEAVMREGIDARLPLDAIVEEIARYGA